MWQSLSVRPQECPTTSERFVGSFCWFLSTNRGKNQQMKLTNIQCKNAVYDPSGAGNKAVEALSIAS